MNQQVTHAGGSQASACAADHMALWKQVEKTPTTATKQANVNGQSITAIDTMHMIRLATQVFGPMGLGWGYGIDEERFDQGAPVIDPQTGSLIAHEQTHTIRLTLWYKWHGERGEVTQYGHTRAVYRTNKGTWMTDGEAPKKSVSDAMKKCLSCLGFAADIFSGLFDDQGYRAVREAETRLAAADDFDSELQKYRDEYADWLKRECTTLREKIPHPRSIQMAGEAILNRIRDRASVARVDPDKGIQMIRQAMADGIENAKRNLADKKETTNG
ncbi:Rad52/Rad22 family DNA repair protein [Salinicola peritrichatus]|uniref:Rad52/Rad22 family DNA repair protein n=1 Tax=Salinicola peritrichatus TaxID=1267424 RepID=UPI0013A646ED|nr:Rad52/Rad22 family DNA repair protein [Salinicola peritrichatus]